jgi:serine/threonine-protein kinase RsbT
MASFSEPQVEREPEPPTSPQPGAAIGKPLPLLYFTDLPGLIRTRLEARELAHRAGFGLGDQTRFVTAVSELGRNALQFALGGTCKLRDLSDARRIRVEAEIEDHGPGIADVELALRDGFSTGGGMGAGLPGIKRISNTFRVQTSSTGTRVTIQVARVRRAR